MILKSFRDSSHSPIIKILFAAIILSFCLWGVGDIIRNYSASKAVFTLDKERFTVEQFLREYSQEKQRIRNIGSKPLTDAEMAKLNIKGLVLNKLVNEAILERAYSKLGIIIPKQSLINIVHSLPQFQNHGTFDSRIYEMAIRRSGISEQGFLHQIRDNVARTQLLHPIMAGYKLPSIIKDIIAKEFESKYTILVSKVNLNSLKSDVSATDEELKQYYSNNQDKYRRPETRDVSILIIDYQKLAGDITVTDEEVESVYQDNKESYKPQETRDFEMFSFDEKTDADKAWDMMNRGVSTKEVVKGLTPDMENVKGIKLTDLPKKIGKDLFSLKKGQASEVYAMDGKFYIYRLTKITESKQISVADIKAGIRKELRQDKMNSPEFYSKIKEMKNKIDDGFGSGKTIDTIAKETGMEIKHISSIQKEVKSDDLIKIVPDEDTRTEVIESIFTTERGQASQMIDSKESDSLSYVVVVNKVRPAKVPEFESIKDRLKNDYILENKDKKLTEELNALSSKGNAVADMKKKFSVKTFRFSKKDLITQKDHANPEVKRILEEIPNPNAVLNIMSALKKGEVSHYKISDSEYIIFGIESIDKSSSISKEFYDVISKYIDSGAASDVVPATLNAFKQTMKLKIDNKLIDEVTKGSDERNEEG